MMSDRKKNMTLDEDALESVVGGVVTFEKPVYDPPELPPQLPPCEYCPACGATITVDAERVQCPNCHRWFRVVGTSLVEE